MMRLLEERQRICPGVSYTMKAHHDLSVTVALKVKWYGYPFLSWKYFRENYEANWLGYLLVLWLITKHTVLYWIRRGRHESNSM
ncbi:hypothetical protein [Aneurinibacillus migulanus]|uniref:hypothetical protein n=1 Tax=Aneurinibacillus migulanus TaxID=47500 RepID=UPI001269D445|nr:hypothetical protein [Aneurinibacillus migulanus]